MAYRILIVEDDNEIGELLEKYLKGNGYETDRAANGLEALNKIEKEDFSLVLLDIMPGKLKLRSTQKTPIKLLIVPLFVIDRN